MWQSWRGFASSMTISRTRWPAAIFAAMLTMLVTWAMATPRYGAPDELAHTVKAYSTAHGQLLGSTTPGVSPLIRTFKVPQGLVSGEPWCFASFPEANAGCVVPTRDSTIVSYESSAATYPIRVLRRDRYGGTCDRRQRLGSRVPTDFRRNQRPRADRRAHAVSQELRQYLRTSAACPQSDGRLRTLQHQSRSHRNRRHVVSLGLSRSPAGA